MEIYSTIEIVFLWTALYYLSSTTAGSTGPLFNPNQSALVQKREHGAVPEPALAKHLTKQLTHSNNSILLPNKSEVNQKLYDRVPRSSDKTFSSDTLNRRILPITRANRSSISEHSNTSIGDLRERLGNTTVNPSETNFTHNSEFLKLLSAKSLQEFASDYLDNSSNTKPANTSRRIKREAQIFGTLADNRFPNAAPVSVHDRAGPVNDGTGQAKSISDVASSLVEVEFEIDSEDESSLRRIPPAGNQLLFNQSSTTAKPEDATDVPFLSPFLMSCIIVTSFFLIIALLALITALCQVVCAKPQLSVAEEDGTLRFSRSRTDTGGERGNSEQMIRLMDMGHSSRKGACNISPTSLPRSEDSSNDYSIPSVCAVPDCDTSITSSALTTFKR